MKLKKVKPVKLIKCDFCNKYMELPCDLPLGCEEYALPDFRI